MRRVGIGGALVALVALIASGVSAEEGEMPLRGFERFELDPATVKGLWGEAGSFLEHEEQTFFEHEEEGVVKVEEKLDAVTSFARIVYGGEMGEGGILIPYHNLDIELDTPFGDHSEKRDGIGDLNLYGKVLPFRSDAWTGGLGFALSVPTGDEDDALGTGEVGFLPFGTVGVRVGPGELGVHLGYQLYTDSHEVEPLNAWIYGGGLRFPIVDRVAVGCDILGTTPNEEGSDRDILIAEPAVDVRIPVAEVDLLVRLAGVAGLNSDSPDWGVGGSLALTWSPEGSAPPGEE